MRSPIDVKSKFRASATTTSLTALAMLLVASVSNGADAAFSGRATTYGTNDYHGGACSLRQSPTGVDPTFFVAMNKQQYGSSCGRCLSVSGPRGTFLAFAADLCDECGQNNLDFSGNLWNAVMGTTPSNMPVSWDFVPCPNPQPVLCLKEGSSSWWLAVQGANMRDGVSGIDIAGQKGTMIGTTAFYFINSNGNVNLNSVPVTITSVGGARTSYTVSLQENQCTPVGGGSSGGGGG
ncbi:hypothetical protein PybrP1_003663, partial [[Pythium] brassicae (nom. inval.)]